MRDGRRPAQARRRRTSQPSGVPIVEGGSSITQQLATRILGHERTVSLMLREAVATMWLSKDEILTRYLTSVYLGNGPYGMPAAAWMYFDKRPAELTLPEAAMLAGPDPQPLARQSVVECRTDETGAAVVIDLRQITALLKEPLRARPQVEAVALDKTGSLRSLNASTSVLRQTEPEVVPAAARVPPSSAVAPGRLCGTNPRVKCHLSLRFCFEAFGAASSQN